MKKSNNGQSAIFDALIFLAVASVVSASLMGAVATPEQSSDTETQSFVERAHSILLRTTPRPSELASLSLDIGGNKTLTLFEVIVLGLVTAEQMSSPDPLDNMKGCLAAVLDGLLTPGYDYAWWAEHNSTIIHISSLSSGHDRPDCSDRKSVV